MSKLSGNPGIAEIYSALDAIPSCEEIKDALENQMSTVQDAVRYLVSVFAAYRVYSGHGSENYWDEALEIVQAVMRLTPPCDDSTLSSRLTRQERSLIARIACLRTLERIPTPYLTHRAFFCDHEFYVDSRVIVPRSPIAEMIESGFSPYLDREPQRVLDMCTGSGCIAVSVALQFGGEAEVDAVDIDQDALDVCAINIGAYDLEDIVTPIRSDLFDALPRGDKYDLIIANPPYVDREDLDSMPPEFEKEPDIALGSGIDGLDCAKRILAAAPDFLDEDGILVMEVGNSEQNLVDAFPQVPFHFVDLSKGGRGVFVLSREQLGAYREVFARAAALAGAGEGE